MTIEERLKRLENKVFGEVESEKVKLSTLHEWGKQTQNFIDASAEKIDGSSYLLHSIYNPDEAHAELQITTMEMVVEEEKDDELVGLCSVLSSKLRIQLLRYLMKNEATSSEMALALSLQAGHMHHHLKELCHYGFVRKSNNKKYVITRFGRDVFLTVGALNRRLLYDGRE